MAARLNLKVCAVYDLVAKGDLTALRFGRKLRIRPGAVDAVRRRTWRQMQGREKAEFKRTRFLWLANPENLRGEQRTRLSALLWLNSPIVKAYLLKKDLHRFWDDRSAAGLRPTRANGSGGQPIAGWSPSTNSLGWLRTHTSTGCWLRPASGSPAVLWRG